MANPVLPPAVSISSPLPTPSSSNSTSTQTALPSPPCINVPGIANFRDIGGYSSSLYPSHHVRQGVIFRSALPTHVTPEGIEVLRNLKVSRIFDLRSTVEIAKMQGNSPTEELKIPGVSIHYVPVFKDEIWTDKSTMQESWRNYTEPIDPEVGYSRGFVKRYQRIARLGTTAYGGILRDVLRLSSSSETPEEGGGVVVHCTAGKDRTGVFSAVILKLCGVNHDTIASEYALTEEGLGEWREIIIGKLLEEGLHGGGQGGEDERRKRREEVERMMSSKKENMMAFLEWLEQEMGGAEGYLVREVGLKEEEVKELRRFLLVKEGGDEQ